MKKSLMLMFAAAISLTACNNFKTGPNGTLYKIHKDGGNAKIKEGDYIKFNFIQSTDKDSIMNSTYDKGQPVVFQVAKKMYDGDMNDVLTFFGEGDSATFKIDLDTMAKKSGQPKPADMKGKYMVFTVKIEKVLSKKPGEVDSLFNKRAGEFLQKDYQDAMAKVKNGEPALIKKYIDDNKLKTTTTASGLHYQILTPGSGAKPALGDTAFINYTVKLAKKKANGKENILQTTYAAVAKENLPANPGAMYAPLPFVLGQGIPGMTEGLQMLSKGGKATLVIPSKLAYGEAGIPRDIPPYATLVFDIEITDIKKGKGAPAPTPVVQTP